MFFSCLGCIRGRRGNRLVYLVLRGRVKWQTKLTAVYRDLNKGTTTKKIVTGLLITHHRENCKQIASKMQTTCKQKWLLFLFIVIRHCSLIAYCVQWISHLLLWLGWMKLRPFPYMAGAFNHQGANKQWNFTGFLGLQCPLVWNIISQWMLVTGILTQFPAAVIL